MKSLLCKSALSLILLTAAVPAMAHENHNADGACSPNLIKTENTQDLSGTFQGFNNGQVLLMLSNNQTAEIPAAAITLGEGPAPYPGSLQVGDPLTVTIPRHSVMRVINSDNGPMVMLGDYKGVYKIPQATLADWDTDGSVWAASR